MTTTESNTNKKGQRLVILPHGAAEFFGMGSCLGNRPFGSQLLEVYDADAIFVHDPSEYEGKNLNYEEIMELEQKRRSIK